MSRDESQEQPERWFLSEAGHDHMVEVSDAGLRKRVVWRRGEEILAVVLTSDEKARLSPGSFPDDEDADADVWTRERERLTALDDSERDAIGAITLRLPSLVGPTRRVTWHEDPAEAVLGTGGVDFAPEPGSKAAARLEWISAHPHLHALRAGLTKGGGIVGSVLAVLVITRWVLPWLSQLVPDWDLPSIPWPDWNLPSIPWPSIPWPEINLPSIPWPDWDLPDVAVPAWVEPLVKYGVPVLIAVLLAFNEARRHRKQEQRRARGDSAPQSTKSTKSTESPQGTESTETD